MLQFQNLAKQYQLGQQRVEALSNITGEISNGEMVALCGPSGSGKSTLLNILGLLDSEYEGQVMFDGSLYPKEAQQSAQLRRSSMGFVFQRFNLVPVMSAWENVAYPLMLNGYSAKQQQRLAMEMLGKVGLEEFAHHRPDHLSGGQQQRVAIARAMVHQPKLVIADEPTASLDSHTAQRVIELMKTLGHELGTTFIVATHDQRMANQCDRTLSLVDGRISEEAMKWAS
ncbi:ABC transporter ATP-binding protein [Vibrio coralliilyticus]|uniref:ABC transporter ATP-binding protein n=1 Tax=Vibrio coralliilyticus TaxID=190893 RepID=A0AAP6ZL93_9VIBR|nr:ABC transporter ATP-binding protein [Vibrio coralliilyticus]NOJ23884.1 ABC transporter ATP-binding protein [Vibrio coralliilyticus]